MGHIFISYNHKDKEYVHRLQEALQYFVEVTATSEVLVGENTYVEVGMVV